MARSSEDAGLLLAAMADRGDTSAIAIEEDPAVFLRFADVDLSGVRLAWSPTAGGLPIAPEIRDAFAAARSTLEGLGVTIQNVEIDLSGADRAWEVIEMFGFYTDSPAAVHTHPELFSPDYVRNIAQGAKTDPAELAFGLRERTAIYRRTAAVLRDFDAWVTPATPVVAPPAELKWVDEIDGTRFDRYFFWQRLACRITMTGHPVLVTPGGFTASGLPFGLQMVGGRTATTRSCRWARRWKRRRGGRGGGRTCDAGHSVRLAPRGSTPPKGQKACWRGCATTGSTAASSLPSCCCC